jgi:hypothetical protein
MLTQKTIKQAWLLCEGDGIDFRIGRKLMRTLSMLSLMYAACSCKPAPVTGQQGSNTAPNAAKSVQLHFYERRVARPTEVLVPPVLLRLSGTLEQKDGCLIVVNGSGDHALVFEKGRATYDAARKVLTVGSASFPLESPISVGGPFNQPSESFDLAVVKERCGVDAVWLVTGADVRSSP